MGPCETGSLKVTLARIRYVFSSIKTARVRAASIIARLVWFEPRMLYVRAPRKMEH